GGTGPRGGRPQGFGGGILARLAHDVPDDSGHRPVGEAAAAGRHAHAGGGEGPVLPGPPAELLDQPRLADAGLAAHEDRGRLPAGRPVEGGDEEVQLLAPPHELGARHPLAAHVVATSPSWWAWPILPA